MRRLLGVFLIALFCAVPATVTAHDGSLRHDAQHDRKEAVKRCGSQQAAGRNIVKDGIHTKRGDRKATNAELRRYMAALNGLCRPVAKLRPVAQVQSSGSVPTSGGGGCGDLPAYIVQRESGGDPNARNGRYGGCAQVDDAHFAAGGACAGLGYIPCVNKLWDGGRGSSNWAQTR